MKISVSHSSILVQLTEDPLLRFVNLSFQGVAEIVADTADAYLLIPGGPGATDLFRYVMKSSTQEFHGTTTLELILPNVCFKKTWINCSSVHCKCFVC